MKCESRWLLAIRTAATVLEMFDSVSKYVVVFVVTDNEPVPLIALIAATVIAIIAEVRAMLEPVKKDE